MDFSGTYALQSSEKWVEFLKESGVGLIKRNLMAPVSPPIHITQTGERYHFKVITPVLTWVLEFELGVEFEDETISGRKCKSVVTREGNSLTQVQVCDDGSKTTTVRQLAEDGELTITLTTGNVKCIRVYKK